LRLLSLMDWCRAQFCDLAEARSFTKAAQVNVITQSAVSQQITSLERYFKALLVERGKRTFRLTRQGELLYESSKQILETYKELADQLKETRELVSGTIRIATIYSIGLHNLPPYLKKFLKGYPGANVHVEYRHDSQVYEDVLGNAVDLGLVSYPTRSRNLEIVPLGSDPFVLICPPQHPFADAKPSSSRRSPARSSSGSNETCRPARRSTASSTSTMPRWTTSWNSTTLRR
jgi:DNA-binding transcriptional LysR family regulator